MILAVILFASRQGIVGVILMGKVIVPLVWRQFADVIDAFALVDQNSIVFAFEASFSEEESSAEKDNTCHEVDNAEEDHESELVFSAVTHLIDEIKESLGNFVVSSDISLSC